ncbi:hypothetical protein VN24_11540 [Paenibacillus beijingensis]|uniref:Uncharacterized protein n=1 Tax=Paenibacillus beijingensis TaxID=1126833 RepID=A0A0D5NI73_9BACL|nr:hypothetical protein VN24_11540 [Paenibacillus beijingensis]
MASLSGVRRFIATESLLGAGVGIFSLILNLHLLDRGTGLHSGKVYFAEAVRKTRAHYRAVARQTNMTL